MRPNHDKATATVTVTGLSVGCFNPDTCNWEVALIRHPRHILTINVTRQSADNTSSQLTFELDQNHSIYIDAIEPAISKGGEVMFTREPFDRKDPGVSDPEDFRWIVDLEKEFNGGAPIKQIETPFPITQLMVAHPLLYADRNDKLDDMQLVKFVSNAPAGDPEPFGTLAESAKADISCHPGGSVVLRIDGPLGFTLPLPELEGLRHEIRIENICPDPTTMGEGEVGLAGEPAPSDFKIYFSMMKPKSGAEFDLKPKHEGGEGSDAVCNNTFLGSRTSLFPL